MFRAYDVRGEYGKTLTPQVMTTIGMTFAEYLKENNMLSNRGVYVSRDIRQSGATLQNAFIAGLAAMGVDVFASPRPLPFGVSVFSGWHDKRDAIAFITASHLPPEWNGVKFYHDDGVGFSEERNMAIRDVFFQFTDTSPPLASWKDVGNVEYIHRLDEYLGFMKDHFELKKPLTTVVDCGNGSMSLISSKLFNVIGFHLEELYCNPDPTFPNRSSEPTEESLQVLAKKVVEKSADFGVGFDGDGDRAIIIDDKGRFLTAEKVAAIIAKLAAQNSGEKMTIVANVECSLILEEALKGMAEIHRIKVGHTFMTLAAKELPSVFLGVESSGHMVFPKYFYFDDATLIPLVLASLLVESNKKLSQLVDELPRSHSKRIAVKCPDSIKFSVIEKLVHEFKSKGLKVNTLDGVRVENEDGSWVLIRASNTSPKIRIIAESLERERTNSLIEQYQRLVEEKIASHK